MSSVARFYKAVAVAGVAGRFTVLLDGKPVKTPNRAALDLPGQELAEAIAVEWRGQGEKLDPATMPLTRLAYAARDVGAAQRARIATEILGFGRSDLLCYRAEAPAALVARQAANWDPMLDWAASRFGARLAVGTGIGFVTQSEAALAALALPIEGCDEFALVALHGATSITGSLVLVLALLDERLDAAEAFRLSRLDEDFQAEAWGRDAEAEARAARLARELSAIAQFLRLCRGRP